MRLALTPERSRRVMSTIEKLIDFIKELTPEQAEKIIRQMPRLIASVEEPSRPDPQIAAPQSR